MGRDGVVSHSVEETYAIGYALGSGLTDQAIVCFFGPLGAGKTTLIKGVVAGAAHYPPQHVNSPTFVYLNIYRGKRTVYHFDLYRLEGADDFLSKGFEEYLAADGIVCIEWPERISPLLPSECIEIHLQEKGENGREINILYPGKNG